MQGQELMEKNVYFKKVLELEALLDSVSNTPYTMFAKVVTLSIMNMRYEKVAFPRDLRAHPFLLTREIVEAAIAQFNNFMDASFIEDEDKNIKDLKTHKMEDKHQELFNEVWDRYDDKDFREYIDRYVHRVRVNSLGDLVKGKSCIDLGCGNGVFSFALLEEGADFVAGVDFGDKSIAYARSYAERSGLSDRSEFKVATVYDTGYPDDRFDFAVQNGVFHHLDDENRAIKESARILKKDGWFWYYTDGAGGISYELWDASVRMLKDVPVRFIEDILQNMNIDRNKLVHLMDGMSATYRHTTWDEITGRLATLGFGDFKRLTGGFETDFDLDRIESDPYGREKFGEGDLRILCRLTDK